MIYNFVSSSKGGHKMKDKIINEIKEWIVSIVVAAVIAFTIKAFIFDIVQVSGPSMIPTLHDNDRVAIEKISLYTKNLPGEK